jgi:curved DNA-binding protein CbpA
MDHYKILEIHKGCSKNIIKKQYHKLSKIYHPDKNDGDDLHFKKIKESYDVLYDDEKRKKYDVQLIFKNVEFSEEEFELFMDYYERMIRSKEFLLMKKLYESVPDSARKDINEKIKKRFYGDNKRSDNKRSDNKRSDNKRSDKKEIVIKEKSIDILGLNIDETIVLYVQYDDYVNNTLKIIHIYTKNGTYYLYLRDFKNKTIVLNNLNCHLTLQLYVRDNIL